MHFLHDVSLASGLTRLRGAAGRAQLLPTGARGGEAPGSAGSGRSAAPGLAEARREEAKDTVCVLQKLLSRASNHVNHVLVNTVISSSLFSTGRGSPLGEAAVGNHGGRGGCLSFSFHHGYV